MDTMYLFPREGFRECVINFINEQLACTARCSVHFTKMSNELHIVCSKKICILLTNCLEFLSHVKRLMSGCCLMYRTFIYSTHAQAPTEWACLGSGSQIQSMVRHQSQKQLVNISLPRPCGACNGDSYRLSVMLKMGMSKVYLLWFLTKQRKQAERKERKRGKYKTKHPWSLQGNIYTQMYISYWQQALNKSHFSCPSPSGRECCPSSTKWQEAFPEVPRCAWSDSSGIYISISYYQMSLEDKQEGNESGIVALIWDKDVCGGWFFFLIASI